MRVNVRQLTLTAVLLAIAAGAAACGADGDDDAQAGGSGATTSINSFEERTFDTWRVGDVDGRTGTVVTGILREGEPEACTFLEIEGESHAVSWPPGSTRTDDGISVGGQVYHFGEEGEFVVVQDYDGPQRPVTCVTTTAWLVVE